MSWTIRGVRLVAMLVAVALPFGCSGGPGTTPATPTASSSASTLTMVTLSDSALGLGGGVLAAQVYADLMAADLGVRIKITPLFYGGSSSGYVLDRIRSIPEVRAAISSADVIVFDVPIGELKDLCPWDGTHYQPAPGTADEYAACGATMVEGYAANATAIMDEIVSLRSPSDALIRTTNLWDFFYPRFQQLGLRDVTHQIYTNVNATLASAAADHGIPMADARRAFMGANGTDDPVAAGYIQTDELHVTQLGADRLGQLLFDLGYDKAP
jgi:lysophospholipase L1-like esterase